VAIVDAVARLVDDSLRFDVDGRLAERGRVHDDVVTELRAHEFFAAPPPRSTGRELFGQAYAEELHRRVPGADGVRTAVALTVESIARFCEAHLPASPELVASGGGTHHPVLVRLLADRISRCDMRLVQFDDLFFASDAKEAVAFALLGWLTIIGQPGNVPGATGASGARVLGCVTPP
jgi:anhydro-N-acetylmuramic acid kinase